MWPFVGRTAEISVSWLPSLKKSRDGDFPGVQGLRLWVSSAQGASLIPGWGTKTPHAAQPENI